MRTSDTLPTYRQLSIVIPPLALVNVFEVNHGTHIYRTDLASHQKNILVQFSLAEEPLAKKHKEHKGKHKRWKSLWDGDG